MHPSVARETWAALEPLHRLVYDAPEATQRYDELGLDRAWSGLVSRAAALGTVPAEVVAAVLFTPAPQLVSRAIPKAWESTPPDVLCAARLDIVDRALRRLLGDVLGSDEMAEAATLARRAAHAACEHPEGRPLFAAHASLTWPDDAHLVLFHAQTLLHEWRNDARTAVLLTEGLSGLDATVSEAATSEQALRILRTSRGWPGDQWAAAVARLRADGVLSADGDPVALALTDPVVLSLTEAGRALRQRIEERTDAAAVCAYEPLGEQGCTRLRDLCRPWTGALGVVSSRAEVVAIQREEHRQ